VSGWESPAAESARPGRLVALIYAALRGAAGCGRVLVVVPTPGGGGSLVASRWRADGLADTSAP